MGKMTETDQKKLLALLEKVEESGLLSATTPAPAQYVQVQGAGSSTKQTDIALDGAAQRQLGGMESDVKWLKDSKKEQGERTDKIGGKIDALDRKIDEKFHALYMKILRLRYGFYAIIGVMIIAVLMIDDSENPFLKAILSFLSFFR